MSVVPGVFSSMPSGLPTREFPLQGDVMNHYPALQLVHAGGILTEALLDGCRLPLTQRERSLLNNLAREPGKVLLRASVIG